jgi:hypothetical protein
MVVALTMYTESDLAGLRANPTGTSNGDAHVIRLILAGVLNA